MITDIFPNIEHILLYSVFIIERYCSAPISLLPNNWLEVLGKCCDGLFYLHSMGIDHCDLKSDNIMVIQDLAMRLEPKIVL